METQKGEVIVAQLWQRPPGDRFEGAWDALVRLPGNLLLEVIAIGAVEGEQEDLHANIPLDQAEVIKAIAKAPNGAWWEITARRVSQDAA